MDSSNVTFILQGYIQKISDILPNLDSIRTNFPGAKIIVSTWDTVIVDIRIPYIEVVVTKDPGSKLRYERKGKKIFHNVNRHLIGVKQALELLETPYCIRVRTDVLFKSDDILKVLFKNANKIIVSHRTTINCSRNLGLPIPYHVCDWIYAGKSSEIKEMYLNTPLYSECSNISNFWSKSKRLGRILNNDLTFPAESWVWMNYLKYSKNEKINIENGYVNDRSICKHSMRCLHLYAYVINEERCGILSTKYGAFYSSDYFMYSDYEYQKNANPNFYRIILFTLFLVKSFLFRFARKGFFF